MRHTRSLLPGALKGAVALLALCVAVIAVVRLEDARVGIEQERFAVGATPITLYRAPGNGSAPLVVVAHGFAGSRQMMEAFSLTLARSGAAVAAFDFRGHGRNPIPMSAEIDLIEGTTAGLVAEARKVASAVMSRGGVTAPVAFIGHSMATDIVIRAGRELPQTGPIVAISMYSDAVTDLYPERLLIVSGAREARLRQIAMEAVRLVGEGAAEGETVRSDGVARRAAVAPVVGHVGVLWSAAALAEARDWIVRSFGLTPAPVARIGPWIAALLGAIVALAWPLARLVSRVPAVIVRPDYAAWRAIAVTAIASIAAFAVAAMAGGVGRYAGVVPVAAFLAVHGALQLGFLARTVRPGSHRSWQGAVALLVWGLVFAAALDRYGASFWPTGPRWGVVATFLPGAVLFAVGDRLAVVGRTAAPRIAMRAIPILALGAAMVLRSGTLGLLFTTLPVLLLFQVVYGTATGWMAGRTGPVAAGLASGMLLAFAFGASQPLFAQP